MKSLHSFPLIFLSGDSQEDTNGALSLSFFILIFSLVDSIQAFGVDHIPFPLFQMLSHAGAPLNHPLLAIHLFWSAEDISQDLCFHSQSVQDISRLLSHSSHLIQPVLSPFQVIVLWCIF